MGASGGHQLSFLKFFEICQDRKAMTHRDHGCVNFAWASLYIAADRCAPLPALRTPRVLIAKQSYLLIFERDNEWTMEAEAAAVALSLCEGEKNPSIIRPSPLLHFFLPSLTADCRSLDCLAVMISPPPRPRSLTLTLTPKFPVL